MMEKVMGKAFLNRVLAGVVVSSFGMLVAGCSQTPAPVVAGYNQLKDAMAANYESNGSFTKRVSGVETPKVQAATAKPVENFGATFVAPEVSTQAPVQAEELAAPVRKATSDVSRVVAETEAVVQDVVLPKPSLLGDALSEKPAVAGDMNYTVQPGDTIYRIARQLNVKPGEILAANTMESTADIEVGQVLRLPGAKGAVEHASVAAAEQKAAAIEPAAGNAAPQPGFVMHKVAAGETVFRISQSYHASVFDIMSANEFQAPQDLQAGMMVKVPVNGGNAQARSQSQTVAQEEAVAEAPVAKPVQETRKADDSRALVAKYKGQVVSSAARAKGLAWPVEGRVIRQFGEQGNGVNHSGINIAAPENSTVLAAEGGKVIYAGDGLKTYGQLVLLRHPDGMVTAYAHNNQLLVNKGESVKKGQVIALSGATGNVEEPQVHFEIRRAAKAVNPMHMLAAR